MANASAKTKSVDHSTDRLVAKLRGLGLKELFAGWTSLMQSLDRRAHTEAEALMRAADTMGILTLGTYIEKHPPSSRAIAWLVKLARLQQRSQFAASAAAAKNVEARQWVRSEWIANRADFAKLGGGFNKIAFARLYATRVAQQFRNAAGDPLKVTPDRIARYWLRD